MPHSGAACTLALFVSPNSYQKRRLQAVPDTVFWSHSCDRLV